jgi:RNA polymerase sigma-70 factor (family 1)
LLITGVGASVKKTLTLQMQLSLDKKKLRSLKKGDKKAFENIYWMFRKPVYGMAFRYLKDHQLAEDAVQDVFFKLWVKRDTLNPDMPFEPFLFSILKNHVLNMIKIKKRRILRQFEYREMNTRINKETDADAILADTQRIFQEGLDQLPEGKQLVFKMKRFEGYTNKEIARELNISVHTVKSQFYKASKFLRSFVKAQSD